MSRLIRTLIVVAVLGGCSGGPPGPVGTSASVVPNAPASAAVPSPSGPVLPSFAARDPLVLFARRTDLGGGVFVMHADRSGLQQLATDILPGVHKRVDWSPDGGSIAFVDERNNRIWIAHLDGSPTALVPGCKSNDCDYPAWSPDGTRIAFSRAEGKPGIEGPGAVGIYVVELATGSVSKVVRLERPLLADAPRWSPDGSQIVFQVDRMDADAHETGAAIAVVSATGGEPRYLTRFEDFASVPDWSWVTNEIVYSVELLGAQKALPPGQDTWNLFGIRPDGTHLRQITHLAPGQHLVSPRWAPDGTKICAKQFDHGVGGGRIVDATTGAVELFPTDLTESRPLFRPNP